MDDTVLGERLRLGHVASLPQVMSTHGVTTVRGTSNVRVQWRNVAPLPESVSHETTCVTESALLEVNNHLAAQQVEQSRLANQQSSLVNLLEKVQVSLDSTHQDLLSVISGVEQQVMMKLESIDLKVCDPKSANFQIGAPNPVAVEGFSDGMREHQIIDLKSCELKSADAPNDVPRLIALDCFSDVRREHHGRHVMREQENIDLDPKLIALDVFSDVSREHHGRHVMREQENLGPESCEPKSANGPNGLSIMEDKERYPQTVFQEGRQSWAILATSSGRASELEQIDPVIAVAKTSRDVDVDIQKHQILARFERLSALAEDFDTRLGYEGMWEVYREGATKKSFWIELAKAHGYGYLLGDHAPESCAARIAEHNYFALFQTVLILGNTVVMAWEADLHMKASLKIPKESVPTWLDVASVAFNIAFATELLFRMFALRLWFWVVPGDWTWNVFDLVLVISSVVLDVLTGEAGFGFLRSFRVLRLLRIARIVRILRFFRQLREMLFAIMACFVSLVWSFVFMGIVMALFSLMCIQGANEVLDQMHEGSLAEDAELRIEIGTVFGSMPDAMLSLLASVTGGMDWFKVYHPLTYSGFVYPAVYVCYMLFITVGVMNVLTGVFLANAEQFVDIDLILQTQESRTVDFVDQMITLFGNMDDDGSGELSLQEFNKALNKRTTQAFLQHLGLDTTHAHLIFELLDKNSQGKVEIHEFVMGMARLKGASKAIDSRVILRELSMIPKLFRDSWQSPLTHEGSNDAGQAK